MVAIGLMVAVLWPPSSKTSNEPDGDASGDSADHSQTDEGSPANVLTVTPVQPFQHAFHPLFPLVKGTKWVYLVTATDLAMPQNTWTLKIVEPPTTDASGVVAMGFGDHLEQKEIRVHEGGVQIGDLPFTAPLAHLNDEVIGLNGSWLPAMDYIIADAVWNYEQVRKMVYRSRGKNNEWITEQATGTQQNRAYVKREENIVVPAGVFRAHLITWLGRIDIHAGKKRRKVLDGLTTEPFRKESTWFAKGIGMVRRRVTYLSQNQNKEDIIFDLVRFERPTAEVKTKP